MIDVEQIEPAEGYRLFGGLSARLIVHMLGRGKVLVGDLAE